MYSLKDHLHTPIFESKNIHLDHVEDLILDDGVAGAHVAINFIEGIRNKLAGHGKKNITLTTKWDGSPSLVCGKHPETGQFFVGTKSVFNKKSPKVCQSKDDIARHYKDQPDLEDKLIQAFDHLSKLGIDNVLQGDFMFTSGDIKPRVIDGEQYITFKPNTITYAVPANSPLADEIGRAKIGIVFHTSYSGDKLRTLKPSFNVNIEELTRTDDVWFDDASYRDETKTATLTDDELNNITRHLDAATKTLGKLDPIRFEQLLTSKNLIGMIKMHTNNQVRSGKQYDSNYLGDLENFIERRIDKEDVKDATKEKRRAEYAAALSKLTPSIDNVVEFQHHINEAKLIILKKLQQIGSIGTFVATDDGYDVTAPEGYVAVDHLTNKAVKLVDRLEFSRNNFNRSAKS